MTSELIRRPRRMPGVADLVLFDPAKIDYQPVHLRGDFPAGAQRLYTESSGISTVFVNGREVVKGGEYTGDLPGTVLRSHRDMDTCTARPS